MPFYKIKVLCLKCNKYLMKKKLLFNEFMYVDYSVEGYMIPG